MSVHLKERGKGLTVGVCHCFTRTHKAAAARVKTAEPCRSVTFPRSPQRPEGATLGRRQFLSMFGGPWSGLWSHSLHLRRKWIQPFFICTTFQYVVNRNISCHCSYVYCAYWSLWYNIQTPLIRKCLWGSKIWDLCMFLLGMKNGTATVEISLTVCLRISIV